MERLFTSWTRISSIDANRICSSSLIFLGLQRVYAFLGVSPGVGLENVYYLSGIGPVKSVCKHFCHNPVTVCHKK